MKIEKLTLPPLTYKRLVWFKGTEEEVKDAEREEEALYSAWSKILSSGFLALEFENNIHQKVVLSPSIYNNDKNLLQLSYFDKYGAVSHRLYSQNEEEGYEYENRTTLNDDLCKETKHGQIVRILLPE